MKVTLNKPLKKQYPQHRIDIEDIKKFEFIETFYVGTRKNFSELVQGILTLKSGEQFSNLSENCVRSLKSTIQFLTEKPEMSKYNEGGKAIEKLTFTF